MDRAARIAVVGPVEDQITGDLRALPLRPEVRLLQSLHDDTEALARFEPDLLVVALGDPADEDIGALRLLRSLWPHLGIVLVTALAGELEAVPIAARIGARLLIYPDKPGQLAATIEQALHGGDRPRAEIFLDLAHGMADEINNPLLFLSGHLQLLHSSLDPATEKDRRDQVHSALEGVQRIQTTLDRLGLLSRASTGPRQQTPIDLSALLRAALDNRQDHDAEAANAAINGEQQLVDGDSEQLEAAVEAVVGFADALSRAGTTTTIELESLATAVRLRVQVRGAALTQWRLPNTFEPFYPSRLLRGHGHGLALFLAQTIVLGHGGQATARRQPDGSLQIDFVLGS